MMDFESFVTRFAEHTHRQIDKIEVEECATHKGKLNFIKIGNLLVNIYGFEYLDSEFYSMVQKLEEIKIKNKLHIIFAENKDKANHLSKEHFDREGSNEKESQYSMLSYDNEFYIFLNYSRLKKEDIKFLISYFDIKAGMGARKEIQERTIRIYKTIVEEYIKSLGYSEPIFNEEDFELAQDFRNVLLHSISDPFALKSLISSYQNKVLDNIKRRIQVFDQDQFSNTTSKLHFFKNFLGLTTVFLGWSIYISLASGIDKEVKELIDNIISNSSWGNYADFRLPFLNYFVEITKITPLCKSQDEILTNYKNCVSKLIKNIPKRLIRINEPMSIFNQAHSLISLFQIIGPKTKKLRSSMEQILKKTDKIILNNKDPISEYIIISARTFLLEQFSIITRDGKLFNQAYKESLENVHFIESNYAKIKTIFPEFPISEDDIVLALNGVGYLCFCHKEFEKFREIRQKINQLMKKLKISIFVNIMINQLNFTLEEDYASLKEVYRLYRNYVSGQFKIADDSSLLAGGAFSEAFFSEDIGSKTELYNQAIDYNEHCKVSAVSLQKDLTQKNTFDQILRLFYHLDLCRLQESPYTFVSELKLALNIAQENISKVQSFESPVYFFLKTKITLLFVEGNYKEIQPEIKKISNFEFNQCKEFQKFIEVATENMQKPYDERLLFISSIKETNDLWIRVLTKYIKQSAEQDYIKEFHQKNKEFSKIRDMRTLLEKFKEIILDGAVKSFWKKKYVELNSNSEEIGRCHLIVFLRALNRFEVTRESEVNFYKMDIFILDKLDTDKVYIIETKVCRDQTTFDAGITQIEQKYVRYKKKLNKKLEAFYVVFDSRKKYSGIPLEVNTPNGKVNIIHIPINSEV